MTNIISAHGCNIDLDTLPQVSLVALAKRGLGHVLGNEVAARVTGRIIVEISTERNVATSAVTSSEIAAYRTAHADAVAQWTTEYRQARLAALVAGTLGNIAERAPRVDPLEREGKALLAARVRVLLEEKLGHAPQAKVVTAQVDAAWANAQVREHYVEDARRERARAAKGGFNPLELIAGA